MARHFPLPEHLRPHDGSDLLAYRNRWNFTGVALSLTDDFSAGTGVGWTTDVDGTVNWTAAGVTNYAVEAYGGPGGNTIVRSARGSFNQVDMSIDFKGATPWADFRRHAPLLLKDGSTETLFVEVQKESGVYYLRLGNNTHNNTPDFLIDVVMSIDPSDGYHTYRIVADLSEDLGGPFSGVGWADVYVDGVLAGSYDGSNSTFGNVASSLTYNKVGLIADSGFWNHHGFFDNFSLLIPDDGAVVVTDDEGNNETTLTIAGGGYSFITDKWVQYQNAAFDPTAPAFPYNVDLGALTFASDDQSFVGGTGGVNLAAGQFGFAETGLYAVCVRVWYSPASYPAQPHAYTVFSGGRTTYWQSNLEIANGSDGVSMYLVASIMFADWFAANEVLHLRMQRGTTITSIGTGVVDTHIARIL